MKHKTIFTSLAIATILLSACGAEATPTISVEDIQSTAVSAAFTIVAETQAAIPTATPLPPTEIPTQTPLPTETLLPTIAVTATNTLASAGGDYCLTRILSAPLGKGTVIKIDNKVKAPVQVSLFLNKTASHDECGFRSFELVKYGSIVFTDLVQGCYNVGAYINDPKKPSQAFGYGCINNPDKWTFEVYADSIKFVGP